ncbi:MAG: metal-dependent hydrolase [Pseudomonadota bacterium]
MKITWFGHSCVRIETGASVLLIDPFLKGNPVFQASGLSFDDAIQGVTHVGLTHGHDDHIGDAGEICSATGATLFAVFELAQHVAGQGAAKLEPMNTGGTVAAEDFKLTLVDAKHSSSSGGTYLGNPCGIVVRPTSGPVVYHMGDTDVFMDMALVKEFYEPEIGIVPIGDRFTMGAQTAAHACQTFFEFKSVIPCHFGTFPILDPSPDAFVAAMEETDVRTPAVGEVMSF